MLNAGQASLIHLSCSSSSHSLPIRRHTLSHLRFQQATVRRQHLHSSRAGRPVQASFSAASHGSLDSVDDEVDFKVDDELKAQIDHMNFQRREENTLETIEATTSEAESKGEWVAAYVGAALLFGVAVWQTLGAEKAEEFFAGYLLEQSLSVDNLFVFILVFKYFRAPKADQDKVLSYGIGTAAILRLVMILLGSELIESWKPVLLLFSGILLFSSFKLLTGGKDEGEEEDLTDNGIVKLCRRLIPVSDSYKGDSFFTIENGKKIATPLLLVLAVVELSDVVFAVDSIPAVFGITHDPFIVYSSNMFAILSLRALYGFVNTIMSELRYLDKAVALVLGFIGAKMLADFGGYHVPTTASLGVVVTTLAGGVAASLWLPAKADSK